MNIFTKISIVWAAAKIAWRHPEIALPSNMELAGSLLSFLFEVAESDRPRMMHFGFVSLDKDERNVIASVWACPNVEGSPDKRIKELYDENESLKKIIFQLKQKSNYDN